MNNVLQILFYVYTERGLHCPQIDYHDRSLKFMSEDQFDVVKGPNLKMQLKHEFKIHFPRIFI